MSTKRVTVGKLKQIIRESLDDELNTVEVGDVVDVDVDSMGILPVRVIKMVDDVRKDVGMHPTENELPTDELFKGPGFVGEIDPDSGESGSMVFSLNQVLPGSKARGYFPKLGTQNQAGTYDDWDDYGREEPNPYRKMAKRLSRDAITPASWGPASDLDESDEDHGDDHTSDPRWDDHADPTGRSWDSGLDQGK